MFVHAYTSLLYTTSFRELQHLLVVVVQMNERFAEALQVPSSGLTYAALSGQRKQSVREAERLFNSPMEMFMKKKSYSFEEKYLCIVLNWCRASDERGLSQSERSRFNWEMLTFIKDDLIPWHSDSHDIST